ncbi:hypothetical protein HanPSC8_Chr06g0256671 [Helianthus annuus]|nr:hypothetical protein HanPSC8_Chr06g0256671 [Helianthus annuus]
MQLLETTAIYGIGSMGMTKGLVTLDLAHCGSLDILNLNVGVS